MTPGYMATVSLSMGLPQVPAWLSTSGVLAIGGDDADTQLSMVIAALVGLAVLIMIVTVIYWRMTRPMTGESGVRGHSDGVGESQN